MDVGHRHENGKWTGQLPRSIPSGSRQILCQSIEGACFHTSRTIGIGTSRGRLRHIQKKG